MRRAAGPAGLPGQLGRLPARVPRVRHRGTEELDGVAADRPRPAGGALNGELVHGRGERGPVTVAEGAQRRADECGHLLPPLPGPLLPGLLSGASRRAEAVAAVLVATALVLVAMGGALLLALLLLLLPSQAACLAHVPAPSLSADSGP